MGGLSLGLARELKRESWALVAIPQTSAPSLTLAQLEQIEPWGILWKRRGYTDFLWLNRNQLASSQDQAMSSITNALKSSHTFVNRHAGGDFYCIPLKYTLRVPYLRQGAGNRNLQSLLVEFGLSTSLEVALGKAQAALNFGTPWPAKSASWWREKLQGTLVVPVPVHRRVTVTEVL